MISLNISDGQLAKLNASLKQHVVDETNRVGQEIFEAVRQDTPVDTGRAQRSWMFEPASKFGETATAGNPIEYVKFLEFGTNKNDPLRFIQRNIKQVLEKNRRG